MTRITLAALALGLAAGAPLSASAQQPANAEPPASKGSEPASQFKGDMNRRVCKTIVPTGTRLAKGRVCKKAREWLLESEESKRTINRMQKIYDNQGG